jgi:hypothetical protein
MPKHQGTVDMNELPHEVRQTIESINQAWRSGRVADITPHLHPDIVMKLPKFSGEIVGRDKLIAGFEEFCSSLFCFALL